jgi:hypothetical protein
MGNDKTVAAIAMAVSAQMETLEQIKTALESLLPVLDDVHHRLDQLEKHDD